MSGHITRMSRGSRVGSSASRPSSTSRSTSTCRAAPWHACTCTLRSSAASARRPGRRALVARSCWSQPSRSARGAGRRRRGRRGVHRVGGLQRALELAQVAAERGEQRVADPLVGVVLDARHAAALAGERVPEGRRGVRQPQVHLAGSPSAASSSTSVTGIRVWPNSENRGGRSHRPGRARRSLEHAAGVARPASAPRPRPRAGARARAARTRSGASGLPGPVGVVTRLPRRAGGRVAGRRTTRTGGPGDGPRRTSGHGAARPPRPPGRGRGAGSARGTTARRRGRRRPAAAARPARRAPTGRPRGCR